MINKRTVGSFYEREAETYLMDLGYRLVDKNVYSTFGEIDLIVEKEGVLFFVEVKYRSSTNYGTPKEALNQKKLLRLERSIHLYLKSYPVKNPKYRLAFLGILKVRGALQFDFIENIMA